METIMHSRFRFLPRQAGLAALLAVATAVPAHAQLRLDTLRMTCAEARTLVVRNGAVVLGTGPHLFDRYVVNVSQCPVKSYTRRAFVRTADSPACFVGETCTTERPWLTPFE
jgi:hypothetical protein